MRRPVGHRITPVAITPNATAAPTMATARALIRWWVISFYEPIAVPWDVIYSTRRYRCGNRDDFATMVLTSGRAADTFGPFLRMYRLIRRVKSPSST
jgi:hypothetical protein